MKFCRNKFCYLFHLNFKVSTNMLPITLRAKNRGIFWFTQVASQTQLALPHSCCIGVVTDRTGLWHVRTCWADMVLRTNVTRGIVNRLWKIGFPCAVVALCAITWNSKDKMQNKIFIPVISIFVSLLYRDKLLKKRISWLPLIIHLKIPWLFPWFLVFHFFKGANCITLNLGGYS